MKHKVDRGGYQLVGSYLVSGYRLSFRPLLQVEVHGAENDDSGCLPSIIPRPSGSADAEVMLVIRSSVWINFGLMLCKLCANGALQWCLHVQMPLQMPLKIAKKKDHFAWHLLLKSLFQSWPKHKGTPS